MTAKRLKKFTTKAVRYTSALGAHYGPDTAIKVGEEIEAMLSADIGITPESILARAKDPESALHPLFTWDNDEAATKYRLWEARQLVNRLRLVVETPDGEQLTRSAFISLSIRETEEAGEAEEGQTRRYFHIRDIEASAVKRRQVLEMAQREVRTWAQKYEPFFFPELAPLINAILKK